MKKKLMVFILLCNSAYSLYAQNRTIKGRVIDDGLKTLPYLPIVINDTVKIGKTDLNGFFQIEIPVSVKKISLEFIGYYPATFELSDNCDEVELIMMSTYTYDFITARRADKLLMKRFMKLPDLHRQAFEKGLFKTGKACYKQEFVPFYHKKRK